LINNNIRNNVVDMNGGGIFCRESHPIIESCRIDSNAASNDGGGIYMEANSNPTITNNEIKSNSTGLHGGGVCCEDNSHPSMTNNIIRDNSATNGGGIFDWSGSTINNNIITGNTAGQSGGIACWGVNSIITNCLIKGNAAAQGAGLMFAGCTPTIQNSVITENVGDYGINFNGCSGTTLSYCNIYNNSGENFGGGGEPENFGIINSINANGDSCDQYYNIFLNPLFTAPNDSNYHLQLESPCIDAGNPDTTYNDSEDQQNPGMALWPSLGTVVNDLGAYGGPQANDWLEYNHDVGVLAILFPAGMVALDTTLAPRAIIYNGGGNAETFPVSFHIGNPTFYNSQVNLNLQPGQMDTVSFASWHADTVGTFTTTCTTQLASDQNPANNTQTGTVAVNPGAGPVITGITPNHGGNTGAVSVEITGVGFQDGAVVKLARAGQVDIIPMVSTFIDSTQIETYLVLNEREIGVWDMLVENPDGHTGIFSNGFSIEEGSTSLNVDIVGPSTILVGSQQIYTLVVSNNGNTDIQIAAIELSVGNNAGLIASLPLAWLSGDSLENDSMPVGNLGIMSYDIPVNGIYSTQFEIRSFSGNAISLSCSVRIIPRELAPVQQLSLPKKDNWQRGTYELLVQPNPPPEGTVFIVRPPSDPIGPGHEACIWYDHDNLLGNGVNAPYVWEMWGVTRLIPWSDFYNRYHDAGFLAEYLPNLTNDQKSQLHNNLYHDSWQGGYPFYFDCTHKCTDMLHYEYNRIGINLVYPYQHSPGDSPMWDLYHWSVPRIPLHGSMRFWKIPGTVYLACEGFFRLFPPEVELFLNILNLISWDPNNKSGPAGFGELHYVPTYETFYYMIHFENVDTATAPASNIWIRDTLDTHLDWSMLEFDTTSHTCQITADSVSRLITWYFHNINLPPNVNPPEGEGWLMYHVKPDSGLPSGTQIRNFADITFDFNEPMRTDTILNTIDALPPSSAVQGLPDASPPNFPVHWSGTDEDSGSGVQSYSIYVSTNGGPFLPWLTYSTETGATFSGEVDSSYAFCSLARDNVGHVEVKTLHAEDSTTVLLPSHLGDVTVYPNPFKPHSGLGHENITFGHPSIASKRLTVPSTVRIYTIAGELVRTLEEPGTDGIADGIIHWDSKNDEHETVVSGIYIYRISNPQGEERIGKIAIIR